MTGRGKRAIEDHFDQAIGLEMALAGGGKTKMPAEVLRSQADRSGEIQLTDAIARLQQRATVLAYEFDGLRLDCGSKLGYLEANVDLGKRHPEIGTAFRRYMRSTGL